MGLGVEESTEGTMGAAGVVAALDATRECVMVQGLSVIVNVVSCRKGAGGLLANAHIYRD